MHLTVVLAYKFEIINEEMETKVMQQRLMINFCVEGILCVNMFLML